MTDPANGAGPTRYIYHCVLRWSDLDAYGHINNARFLTLYEEARVALMFVGGRARGLTSFADGVVIRRHEVDYLRPVDYGLGQATADEAVESRPMPSGRKAQGQSRPMPSGWTAPTVRIEMWVEEIRASRFTICYELFDGDVLASRARSVLVPFDLHRQTPRRLTDDERAFLLPYAVRPPATVGGGDGGG